MDGLKLQCSEIQENGNFDEKGNDRINEGKVQSI